MLATLIDLVLHLDQHLAQLSQDMGPWTYIVLFAIIFAETGLIVTPFLPGDSLLFAAGSVAALDHSGLDIKLLWLSLTAASFLGDNVNYTIGRWVGPRVFSQPKSALLNPEHLRRAHDFYVKHGNKTVFVARFLPILRTFAPFVAGVAGMHRRTFMIVSALGSVTWMTIFLGAGYGFGNIPWVQRNFSAVIMAFFVLPAIPIIFEALRSRFNATRGAKRS